MKYQFCYNNDCWEAWIFDHEDICDFVEERLFVLYDLLPFSPSTWRDGFLLGRECIFYTGLYNKAIVQYDRTTNTITIENWESL